MKRALLLLFLASPASALDLLDRVQIPEKKYNPDRTAVYASTLIPRGRLPLFQLSAAPGGGGGLSPSSVITGITDCAVLYNNGGVLGGDATNFCWTDAANAAFLTVGSGTNPGAVRLLEGSGGGTNYGALTVPATLGGNRTYTFPDTSGTVWISGAFMNANYFTGPTSGSNASGLFVGDNTAGAQLQVWTDNTPDTAAIGLVSVSNSIHIIEAADRAFDFNNARCGTSACTNPSLIIRSPDQSTTEYLQQSVDAAGTVHLQGNLSEVALSGTKTAITESSAQALIRIGLPTSTNVYGATVFYTVYDINGSNYVARTGQVRVQGGNASGTVLCTINTTQDTEGEDGSQIVTSNAYTLTYTWTNAVSTTNCDLSINGVSSAGTNTYAVTWTAVVNGNSSAITVTAQ